MTYETYRPNQLPEKSSGLIATYPYCFHWFMGIAVVNVEIPRMYGSLPEKWTLHMGLVSHKYKKHLGDLSWPVHTRGLPQNPT